MAKEDFDTNNLTPTENRIRVVVEHHLDVAMKETYESFDKAFNAYCAQLEQNFRVHMKEQEDLNRKLREDQKELYKRLRDRVYQLETAGLPEVQTVAMPFMPPNIDKVVPKEHQPKVVSGLREVFEKLEGKSADEAQRLLYQAGDQIVKLTASSGEARKYVHLEKKKVVLGAGACVAVGIGLGVGGTVLMTRRTQRRAGYSREDYKTWLKSGTPPAP